MALAKSEIEIFTMSWALVSLMALCVASVISLTDLICNSAIIRPKNEATEPTDDTMSESDFPSWVSFNANIADKAIPPMLNTKVVGRIDFKLLQ